jgi:hypothetical protein
VVSDTPAIVPAARGLVRRVLAGHVLAVRVLAGHVLAVRLLASGVPPVRAPPVHRHLVRTALGHEVAGPPARGTAGTRERCGGGMPGTGGRCAVRARSGG